jgi:hypothetical protein
MYVRWVTYRCPSCNARTESRVVNSTKVGLEYKKCRSCGNTYRTPDREWMNMTTGQRVGYFLNEWSAGALVVCAFIAGVNFFADHSTWKFSLWVMLGGIACCAPFWLWKFLNVKRSIARTSELSYQQVGMISGDVQGLQGPAAQTVTTTQTSSAPSSVTYEAPKKRSGIGLGWKIRLGIIGVAALFGFLESQWKTIDKYFPALNKTLHSGTPTSESDLDYVLAHMQQDEEKLSEECPDQTNFEKCRAHTLAKKPVLDDLKQQLQSYKDAWAKEMGEQTIPAACQTGMSGFFAAKTEYARVETEIISVVEAMDSKETMKKYLPKLDELSQEEQKAVEDLQAIHIGHTCDGY